MIERTTRLVAIAAASLYAAGILIVNLYLVRFGAVDFDQLRPRYILTGLLAVLPIAFSVLYPLFGVNFRLTADFPGKQLRRFFIVFTASVPMVPYFVLTGDVLQSLGLWITGVYTAAFAAMAILYATNHLDLLEDVGIKLPTARSKTAPIFNIRKMSIFVGVGGAVVMGALFAIQFAANIYPHVPAQLGGGQPVRATLYFDATDESVASLLSATGTNAPDGSVAAALIAELSDDWLLTTDDQRTIRVNKAKVSGMELHP